MQFTTPARAFRRIATVALFAAGTAMTAGAQTPTPSAADFTSMGGNVSVRFLGSDAADRSVLFYQIGNTFNPGGAFTQLFINNGPGATAPGTQVNIGNVAAGTNIFFRLVNETQAANSGLLNFTFYSGPATRNPDNRLHVGLTPGSGTAAVGGGTYMQGFNFEDRSGTVSPLSDFDYNDLRFEIANATVIPEPSTYALMATGLLGLGGFAVRRRRSNG
ncbi:MAG TPA: PEP-CTERM sorting domain-containing protein [Gemmatirosa sp.]|nr:PEP-CTERM sorting domain-containing protein [Gemmatirosa sp.]